ncbi:sugar transferase [Thermoleptolyngbya sichuanensis XZ-Cy5]|uniref:sugar transferase n=1 Tax=Thermoleptolyngbya sichuanensis TaxID=2885951 RepID=UPI00240D0AC9|nr:sugar transferase [Thermoleptolyngbya sichuanensis]MDG2617992.1 sugar transferase [Thermoleptolyngbya sichuanensis XZ-Cy5]
MVSIKSLSLGSASRTLSDLRSPAFTQLRRGVAIGWVRMLSLLVSDGAAILLAWGLAVSLGTELDSPWSSLGRYSFLPLILAVKLGVMISRGLYGSGLPRRDYLGVVKALSLAEGLLLLIAFLYEPDRYVSRSTFLISWFLSVAFVCSGRFLIDRGTEIVRKRGAACYPVFLICDDDEQQRNIQLIEKESRYRLMGVASARALDRRNRDETIRRVRELGIAELFVSWTSIQNRLHLCWHFQTAGITLRILPGEIASSFPKSQFRMMGELPTLTLEAPVLVGSDFWVKRFFDFWGAAIAILVFSPLYVAIALLIRMDSPGPIFFRQTRVGLHGNKFKVWKFRTMVQNAAQLQAVLEAQNEMKDGVLFKMKDDPRITRIGKFLRRYSLDELPQLFNVLVGEMSFVGPRPLPVRDVERFQERHFIRQEVLPGITGLWQVSGRSDITDFEKAVQLDLIYITNWSLWLDLKILLKTVQVVIGKSGAY